MKNVFFTACAIFVVFTLGCSASSARMVYHKLAFSVPEGYVPMVICPDIIPGEDGKQIKKKEHWKDAVSNEVYVEYLRYFAKKHKTKRDRVKAKEVVCDYTKKGKCDQFNREDAWDATTIEPAKQMIIERYRDLGYDVILIPVVQYGPNGDGGSVSTIEIDKVFWKPAH